MLKSIDGGRGGGFAGPRSATASMLDSRASFWKDLARVGAREWLLGFPNWERLTRPTGFQYVILAARPGMFKTTLAWTWAVNLALSGRKVLWLGVEMGNSPMHGWALARLLKIPLRQIEDHGRGRTSLSTSDEQRLRLSEAQLETLPLVKWTERTLTLDELKANVRALPYDAVFLDYLGLVQAEGREYERIGSVSRWIAEHTRDHPTYFVALAQMNREIERTQGGKPRVPNLSDLKGTGQLEADADVVAFLHRDPKGQRDEVQLRVEKNRHGPTGIVDLRVQPEIKLVEEARQLEPVEEERSDGHEGVP